MANTRLVNNEPQRVVEYEYYNNHFPRLSEERFNALNYRTERYVMKRIKYTYDELMGQDYIDVMDCICDMINFVDTREQGRGITSISNDGYSVAYKSQKEYESIEELYSILQEWCSHLIVEYWGF